MNHESPAFWNERYSAGHTPWDLGRTPARLAEYLKRVPVTGRALVPGCGYGHEIRALHEEGWPVLGLDFSPAAVAQCQQRLGPLHHLVRVGDFFNPAPDLAGFALVYERAFLCALSPARRDDYARRMAALIVPGGVLCGFFFFGPEDEPPPYPIAPAQLDQLLGRDFARAEDQPVADSLPLLAGRERWQVWRRRP